MDIISMDVAETENVVGENMVNGGLNQRNTSLQERNRPSTGSSSSSQQRSAFTWFPYEHSDPEYKCKLNCFSRDTREYYQTGENVIDGTPCSYDNPSDVCVQGKCIKLGCDKVNTRIHNYSKVHLLQDFYNSFSILFEHLTKSIVI